VKAIPVTWRRSKRRFQFSRQSPIAQWAVRFRTAPRLDRLSVKSDRRAQAAAMMPLIRSEVTPALSASSSRVPVSAVRNYCTAIVIEKVTGWFVVSVKRRRADLVHTRCGSPDRLDGARVPRSWEVLPCGLESGCAWTPTYDDPMAGR
jgi:hypothetical protein